MIISNRIIAACKHSTTFFCRCPKLKIRKAARLLISHRYVIGDTQPICHSSSAMLIKTVGFYSCYCCYMCQECIMNKSGSKSGKNWKAYSLFQELSSLKYCFENSKAYTEYYRVRQQSRYLCLFCKFWKIFCLLWISKDK